MNIQKTIISQGKLSGDFWPMSSLAMKLPICLPLPSGDWWGASLYLED